MTTTKMRQSYYTYQHNPGYGREDHLAQELIARAARQLGAQTSAYIAAAAGFASHQCPMSGMDFRLPVARGTAARMRGALRRARREWPNRTYGPDCAVVVVRIDV